MPRVIKKVSEREFGVEIECGYRYGGEQAVAQHLRSKGYPWSVGYDGDGVEVRTPRLKGYGGFKTLRNVFKILNDLGCHVTNRSGLHVHHNAPEFVGNREACITLIRSWLDNQETIHSFVAEYRRRTPGNIYGYPSCPAWTETEFEEFSDPMSTYLPRRHDLNLSSLLNHRSIEIRLHQGTLNADEACAWVRFGQRFIQKHVDKGIPVPTAADRATFMRELKIASRAARLLENKAQHRGRLVSP